MTNKPNLENWEAEFEKKFEGLGCVTDEDSDGNRFEDCDEHKELKSFIKQLVEEAKRLEFTKGFREGQLEQEYETQLGARLAEAKQQARQEFAEALKKKEYGHGYIQVLGKQPIWIDGEVMTVGKLIDATLKELDARL